MSTRANILEEILCHKREEVGRKKAVTPMQCLDERIAARLAPASLVQVLSRPGVALIAEIKRRSPTKPDFRKDFLPQSLAASYIGNGAAAISVIADERYFGGGPHIVEQVAAEAGGRVPVIYKDFIIDPYQVAEARAAGADAVLTIVRTVEPVALAEILSAASGYGMNCIVEIFSQDDAERAVVAGAAIIGINNRDLATFHINLERSARLREALPPGVLAVSESGLTSGEDVRRAGELGFDAVLVGEAIVGATDIGARVREFVTAGKSVS